MVFLVLLFTAFPAKAQETATWEGKLIVGQKNSAIIYYGEESGDLVAFCFRNASKVGQAIFAKCRNGNFCKVTGQVESDPIFCNTAEAWAKRYKLGGFSDTAKIISVKSVKKVRRK